MASVTVNGLIARGYTLRPQVSLGCHVKLYRLVETYSASACARAPTFSLSRLVVGSSSVSTPQLRQNASANASLITIDAST